MKKSPPPKKNKSTAPTCDQLRLTLDRAVRIKATLQAYVEALPQFKKLAEVEKDISDLVETLKGIAVKKGDLETKYYRFTNVDRRVVDYKSMMESIISDKKASPKYLAKFINISHSVQATLLKVNTRVPPK